MFQAAGLKVLCALTKDVLVALCPSYETVGKLRPCQQALGFFEVALCLIFTLEIFFLFGQLFPFCEFLSQRKLQINGRRNNQKVLFCVLSAQLSSAVRAELSSEVAFFLFFFNPHGIVVVVGDSSATSCYGVFLTSPVDGCM